MALTRTEGYMALNSVRSMGPVRVRKLLSAFGSVENILSQTAQTLTTVEGISHKIAEGVINWAKNWDLENEWKKLEKLGAKVIDCEDPYYPNLLKEIYDPPLVLYYMGDLEALKKKSLAIIGSRHATPYGFETARKLSYQAAYGGLAVTSGLARGIDTAAHQGALAAKGCTIAVLGSSLDAIYPEENRVLAEKIAESGGIVLSEFSLGTAPERYTFPMRNRVVSGLSEGVLVVEAGLESGALITARMAVEQGRQVFAVPGRVDNPHAKGCHKLLKEGARLVENIEDIFEEFGYLIPSRSIIPENRIPKDLTKEEITVLQSLTNEEVHIDVIIRKSGLQPAQVSSTLIRLELKKLVRQLPGKCFIKIC